jgi:adenosylcobinamide-GDP ribazoletransferase
MSTQRRLFLEALRGLLIGAVGGAVYWLSAQLWPTSIAVVLSMLATAVLPGGTPENAVLEQPSGEAARNARVTHFGMAGFVFALLLKYNTLMALSAASLPFAAPANVALGLIMICGHAASRALAVSLLAASAPESRMPVSNGELVLVLALGFAPATLLGIPGLIGLAVALLARVAFGAYFRRNRKVMTNGVCYAAQQLTEVCFYLGALASWVYV